MASIQQWLTVGGLIMDFYGVLLLTRELPFIFGRGLRRFTTRVGKRNLNKAILLQQRHAKIVVDQEKEKRRWLQWPYNMGKWGLRCRSRIEARYMNDNAEKFEASKFELLDMNGILDPVAVMRYSEHLNHYLDDLLEHGEARDLSVQGLKWIIAGLAMQILGSLPLPW